jgi:2-methylcitrate dehydratase
MPEQYITERIQRKDVQFLLRKVFVRPSLYYSKRFPEEMPCRLKVILNGGRTFVKEKLDYKGFRTHPAGWADSVKKFEMLSRPYTDAALREEIINAVASLEGIVIADLISLLAKVNITKGGING